MSIKSPLSRQFGSRFDSVFDVVKSNPVYDKVSRIPTLDLDFAKSKSLYDGRSTNNLITFTRNSTGTYVGSDGLIKTAAVNEARFDHNPTTGESLGLLVEESRTNLITDSSLTTVGAATGATITSSTETNPENISFCRRILSNPGTDVQGHRLYVNSSSANTITVSVFVKKDTHRYVYIGFGGISNSFTALFDIEPGVTANRLLGQGGNGTHTNVNAGYQDFPNGWVRIWASGTTSGINGFTVGFSPDATTYNITDWSANGTEAFFVYGAQYEDNVSFPTSYIPTTGATATRAVDAASISGSNFSSWHRQDEGTVFAQTQVAGYSSTNNPDLVALFGANFATDKINMFVAGASPNYRAEIRTGNINQLLQNVVSPANIYDSNNFAIAYKENDSVSYGRNTNATDTLVTLPVITSLYFSGSVGSTKYIRRITYWDTRLPNEKLKSVTA